LDDHDIQRVRSACLQAALDAYEDAGLRGLCAEGRWEYALAAIRRVDRNILCPQSEPERNGPAPPTIEVDSAPYRPHNRLG
jgi:hypothetical protein